MVERGITYLCMTDQNMGYRIPYSFLIDVANRFRATYSEKILTAGAGAFTDTFSRVLQERMDFYSNDRNADKITKVKGEIEEAKTIMVKNIDKVLERGERIEVLVDKTEDLNNQAQSFKVKSTKLKRAMWWKNAKLCAILICIVTSIIASLIFGLLYYFGVFDHHSSSGNNNDNNNHSTSTTESVITTGTTGTASTTGGTTGTTGVVSTTNAAVSLFNISNNLVKLLFKQD